MQYEDLEPNSVFRFFREVSNIPRPSGHEEGVTQYLQRFASERGLWCEVDERGNALIRKPATKGREAAPSVCLQGHTDMVAVKRSEVEHDFLRDPIKLIVDNDWLHAGGTTLGADNGIGVAMALAVLDSTDISHGQIECLFTVDEEVSLGGALALREGWLNSPYLVNLDTEEEGGIVVGCAGGKCLTAQWTLTREALPEGYYSATVGVSGLSGGHSGCDIHKGHANGIKLLAALLNNFLNDELLDTHISSITGGSKHNAIPIEASAVIAVPMDKKEALRIAFNIFTAEIEREYHKTDPQMKWALQTADNTSEVFNAEEIEPVIKALVAVRDGVYAYDQENPALVHTSNNIAIITTNNNVLEIIASQRSDSEFGKEEVTRSIQAAFELAHPNKIVIDGDYPGWTPVYDSLLLRKAQSVYQALTSHEAIVNTIHAGLECGLISKKYPTMEMISIGPTVHGAHTPEERLHIPAMQTSWQHLVGILSEI